jgi:hypothetical protein
MTIENQNGYITIDGKKYAECTLQEQTDFNNFLKLYKKDERIKTLLVGKNKKQVARDLSDILGKSETYIYQYWLNTPFSVPDKYFDTVVGYLDNYHSLKLG